MEARNSATGNTIVIHRKNLVGEVFDKQLEYILQGARMIMLEKLVGKDNEAKSGESEGRESCLKRENCMKL